LDELGEILEGKCRKQIVCFAFCETLDLHGHSINAFLRRTEALAVIGYRERVDWVQSAGFDVLLLGSLQQVSLTKQGMAKLERLIDERAGSLKKRLGFRMTVVQ
jgi:hypothetical protein